MESDKDFEAWRDSLPATHWARYDLSACHLGWNAAKELFFSLQAGEASRHGLHRTQPGRKIVRKSDRNAQESVS